MRIVIISDVHSNVVALEAVLDALPAHDEIWCLGDTIGYGPDPNPCLITVRDRARYALTGNHDLACLGEVSLADFNMLARIANQWNGKQIQSDLRAYIRTLPAHLDLPPDATLAHGSPRDPIWEYVLDALVAIDNLSYFDTPVCFIGHSHVPIIFAYHADGTHDFHHAEADETVQLQPDSRYIFNPGSVGQPRDGDPRAAYVLWDTESSMIHFRRVTYDIAETQRRMRAVGLPAMLADRLAYGL